MIFISKKFLMKNAYMLFVGKSVARYKQESHGKNKMKLIIHKKTF